MKFSKALIVSLSVLISVLGTDAKMSCAEDFPTKHITIVCGFSPGGSTDIQTRGIIPYLQKNLDKGVIVENRTGANGILAYNEVFSSKPDGYTLLVTSFPAVTIAEKYFPDTVKFKVKNYSHIFVYAREELILVTNPAMYKSFQEFINSFATKPDKSIC